MILSTRGLFFIEIIQAKRPENLSPLFKFSIKEYYFPGANVKGAFEYNPGMIIAITSGSENIRFINRNSKEDKELEITNLSKRANYICLKAFPNYSYETFPYLLIKDD